MFSGQRLVNEMMSGGRAPEASATTTFNGITPTTTHQQQQQQQQQSICSSSSMLLAGYTAEGTAFYKPLVSEGDGVVPHPPIPPPNHSHSAQLQGALNINSSYIGSGSEPVKKKRGRPRKYGPSDGNLSMNILSSSPPLPPHPPPVAATNTTSGAGSASTAVPLKKARGRPPGSTTKKHHLQPMGSVGAGFTPHVITVKAGEDVSSKIMSLSQHGSRTVCILSANGAISNATLCQPATLGGTVTYEGRFDILSLSGSFMLTESGGQRGRSGGLSVLLSGPDGRVLGGGVAGPLTAASPLQVVVGSFIADGSKGSKSGIQVKPLSIATSLRSSSPATGPSSPQSRGTLSESPGAPGSPINQSTGACNNHSAQVMSSMPWK